MEIVRVIPDVCDILLILACTPFVTHDFYPRVANVFQYNNCNFLFVRNLGRLDTNGREALPELNTTRRYSRSCRRNQVLGISASQDKFVDKAVSYTIGKGG